MKVIGIISEYNPFHFGHMGHIKKSISLLHDEKDSNIAVVCVMSGNFVQRGEPAIFNKHARAEAAIRNGADLIIELPTPYAVASAEVFAESGVYILENTGVCDFISFGSESGDIKPLKIVSNALQTDKADILTAKQMENGITYATARQLAADELLGDASEVLKSPNNLLGIEYLRALDTLKSSIKPITVRRTGGAHDSESSYSASFLRKRLLTGHMPWGAIPHHASDVYICEIASGRGPVSMKSCEIAILSRLRIYDNYSNLTGASEGLEYRFKKFVKTEPTIEKVLEGVKTKRYIMSRLRRMLINASLDITTEYIQKPPPYIRVLAMNKKGKQVLKNMQKKAKLPIIIKPASAQKLEPFAVQMFQKEVTSTDLYTLAYSSENERYGGREWLESPIVL
jgi:predicted nucleotidyltransferase